MSKTLILSAILMISPVISTYDGYIVIKGFGSLKGHSSQTWKEAVETCNKEGAVLSSPLDDDFSHHLEHYWEDFNLSSEAAIFTGISNFYSSAVYQSMEGVPISDICLTWASEPEGTGSTTQNCIAMYRNGAVAEVPCTEPRPFVCYKKYKKTLNCPTQDPGYIFYDQTGSCYKLHKDKANWHEAFRVCNAEGGHLAIVNSQAEAEIIYDIGKNSPWTYALALGFREWGKERTWITIQGQSLKDAGYDHWYPGEPNILTENCGSFVHWGSRTGGILADMPCYVDVMFICEIEVEKKKDDHEYDGLSAQQVWSP